MARVEFYHGDDFNEHGLPMYTTVIVNGWECGGLRTDTIEDIESTLSRLITAAVDRATNQAIKQHQEELRTLLGINA